MASLVLEVGVESVRAALGFLGVARERTPGEDRAGVATAHVRRRPPSGVFISVLPIDGQDAVGRVLDVGQI